MYVLWSSNGFKVLAKHTGPISFKFPQNLYLRLEYYTRKVILKSITRPSLFWLREDLISKLRFEVRNTSSQLCLEFEFTNAHLFANISWKSV